MLLNPVLEQLLQQRQQPPAGPQVPSIRPHQFAPTQPNPAPTGVNALLDAGMGVSDAGRQLLSANDLKKARSMGLIGAGIGMMTAQGGTGLGGVLAGGLAGLQGVGGRYIQQAQEAEKQQLERDKVAKRQALMSQFRAKPGETPHETYNRLQGLFSAAVEMGDTELTRSLSEVIKSMKDSLGGAKGPDLTTKVGLNPLTGKDELYTFNPQTGKLEPTGVQPGQSGGGAAPSYQRQVAVNPATGRREIATFNPRTKEFEFTGLEPGDQQGRPTEAQAKAQLWDSNTVDAVAMLDQATTPNRLEQLAASRGVYEAVGNERELFDLAGRKMAEAWLRVTTGAAYNQQEFDNAMTLMTPRSGDGVATLMYKKQIRDTLRESLRAMAQGEIDRTPENDPLRARTVEEAVRRAQALLKTAQGGGKKEKGETQQFEPDLGPLEEAERKYGIIR